MFAEERQAEIAALVGTTRRVNGAELARRFDVTMETVRRDLAALRRARVVLGPLGDRLLRLEFGVASHASPQQQQSSAAIYRMVGPANAAAHRRV